jgi:hypothetical protein
MRAREIHEDLADRIGRLQASEMAGVEDVDLRLWRVTQIGEGSRSREVITRCSTGLQSPQSPCNSFTPPRANWAAMHLS